MRALRCPGFTLIEVLVAIAILALVSVLGYRSLRGMLDADARLSAAYDESQALRDVFQVLESDLEQIAGRGIRDELGGIEPALSAPPEQSVMRFTRHVAVMPLSGAGVDLRRIEYALTGDRLLRKIWYMLDRAPGEVPVEQVLLSDVASVRFRFFSQDWIEYWPAFDDPVRRDQLPLGIEISIQRRGRGALRRVFLLAPA